VYGGDFGGCQKVFHAPQTTGWGNRTLDLYRESDLYLLDFEGAKGVLRVL
jgi:hypothetical protein